MLKLEGLSVFYGGIHALRGIDVEVPDAQIISLIGANGAGKSTMLNTIVGLVKPAAGKVLWDGEDITGGEQQMLAVARGLMSRPKILMLDEPSLGLAPIVSRMIFDIIREINRNGTTILLIEQNARAALEIANYAYVLETGVITMQDVGAELLKNDGIRRAYLGES
jgi:ABC-type branched-subunit amino acid transport system ATPase component